MLSANQMVKVRKAIETMYDAVCTIIIREEYEKDNSTTGFRNVVLLEDEPCHIKYSSVKSAVPEETAANVSQEIRLFISPDIEIPAGSRITVNQVDYARSGVVAEYATHQEIVLSLWKGWS